jgi:hypothetical protein
MLNRNKPQTVKPNKERNKSMRACLSAFSLNLKPYSFDGNLR